MTNTRNLPRGGVIPPNDSLRSRSAGISNAAVPSHALIPLLQHDGSPARCLVKPGDVVQEAMLIGAADGPVSANVHASIPGTVTDVRTITLPGGVSCEAVAIDLGGEFGTSGRPRPRVEWTSMARHDVLARIQKAGVVSLGADAAPAHLRLSTQRPGGIGALVANGVDSEPSLSAGYALLLERPEAIAEALRICRHLLGAERVVLAVAEDAGDLVPLLERSFKGTQAATEIALLPDRYPWGHEQLVTSRLGIRAEPHVVIDIATLHAIYEAVVLDKPLIERVLTVAGPAVERPRNLKVRIGTRLADVLEDCGGLIAEPGKVVVGGPMTGLAVDTLETPVTKSTSGVIAIDRDGARVRPQWPCVRCGACLDVCPWGLAPTRLYKLLRAGLPDAAADEGLGLCTECGCCSFACPSRLRLAASFHDARIAARKAAHG
jgi:Na+-translocating ferredoxin:NAD+ oxidoreductase subunit C